MGDDADLAVDAPENQIVRERATTSGTFDPAEVRRGHQSDAAPSIALAALPLVIVVGVNLLMSLFVLPRLDASYLADLAWGSTSLSAVAGVWAVVTRACDRHRDADRHQLPSSARVARKHGCRCQCVCPSGVDRRQPRRLRFGRRGAPGLRDSARLGSLDRRRSAGFTGRRDQCARISHRFGFRRTDDRARRAR